MDKLWKLIKHYQASVISIVVSSIAVIWVYGCSSTVPSIVNPPDRLTRIGLQGEVDAFLAKAELRFDTLDQQDKLKSTVFNAAISYAQGGTVNPVGIAITLAGILGIGAAVDNRHKDKVIKTLKNNVPTNTKES